MPDGAHHEDWHPRHNPWLIAFAVMMAVFMEVLDTSIANIALPHIAGSLSATNDEATWVLTSYLVSNAIILPMTGWLGNYFGRKRVLLSCVMMFTFASVLCGWRESADADSGAHFAGRGRRRDGADRPGDSAGKFSRRTNAARPWRCLAWA